MTFTDGKPFVVTADDIKGFSTGRPFACERCRGEFAIGEIARWQYMHHHMNIMVCVACDTPDLIEWWSEFWPIVAWYGQRYFNDYPCKPTGRPTKALAA